MITLGQVEDFTHSEMDFLKKSSLDVNEALFDPNFIQTLLNATWENTDDDNATIVQKLTSAIVVDHIFCENLGWWATNRDHTIAEEALMEALPAIAHSLTMKMSLKGLTRSFMSAPTRPVIAMPTLHNTFPYHVSAETCLSSIGEIGLRR